MCLAQHILIITAITLISVNYLLRKNENGSDQQKLIIQLIAIVTHKAERNAVDHYGFVILEIP